jgi:hypothetical protein
MEKVRQPRRGRSRPARRVLVALLLVLGTVLTPVTIVALFVKTQITDTDRYVQNVAPLSSDRAVQAFVADDITKRFFVQVDVASYVRDALPERAAALVQPVTSALESFVRDATLRILQSAQFQSIWAEANRAAHTQLVKVLTGEGRGVVVASSSGVVAIDLSAVVSRVQQRLADSGIGLFSSLPVVKVGRQIPVFQSKDLYKARRAVGALDRLALILPLVVFGSFGSAILLAANRRRALFATAVGFALGALVLAVALAIGRGVYLDAATNAELPHDAAAAVYDTLVRFLHTSIRSVSTFSTVVIVALFFAGPSRLATWFRDRTRWTTGRLGAECEHAGLMWLAPLPLVVRFKTPLRVATAAIAFVTLFRWSHPTPAVILWTAVAALVALGVIEFFGRIALDELDGPDHGDANPRREKEKKESR